MKPSKSFDATSIGTHQVVSHDIWKKTAGLKQWKIVMVGDKTLTTGLLYLRDPQMCPAWSSG